MMEKKYQLVAWTKNITDRENARLYVVPSVELDLMEPLITEVSECQRLQKKDGGRVSPQLARRFIISTMPYDLSFRQQITVYGKMTITRHTISLSRTARKLFRLPESTDSSMSSRRRDRSRL